jgi:NADH-quinone oxidoreductase subunit N
MDISVIILELAVGILALALLLLDLWTPSEQKRDLGWAAVVVLGLVLAGSFLFDTSRSLTAFGGLYVLDGLAMFFKRLSLLAAMAVIVMSMHSADPLLEGIVEYYALTVLALLGMMFAASANDFSLLFVSLELITVTFYILVAIQRKRLHSIEAGIKYLVMGALASAFLVYGIALVYGASGTLSYVQLATREAELVQDPIFVAGMFLVLVGLGFKIAAFPFQLWVPDVYQGAATPTTAFLAAGSKAAGFVLLLRLFGVTCPDLATDWRPLWMVLAVATILYGNLCAIPQRNVKRLLGYSGIAHAGYLLLGLATLSNEGFAAVLFYLAGYIFAVLGVLFVVSQVEGGSQTEDFESLAGLHHRSPVLAGAMALSMVSLAGIPPMAGFFGKFLLLKAVFAQGAADSRFYWLGAIALVGVVISIYYYLGVVRSLYWPRTHLVETDPIIPALATRICVYACMTGMLALGMFPGPVMDWTVQIMAAVL